MQKGEYNMKYKPGSVEEFEDFIRDIYETEDRDLYASYFEDYEAPYIFDEVEDYD